LKISKTGIMNWKSQLKVKVIVEIFLLVWWFQVKNY